MAIMKTNRARLALAILVAAPLAAAHAPAAPAKPSSSSGRAEYQVDAKKSRFIVETQTSGLSSMFGHDHKIEIREFSGVATFPRSAKGPATLELTVRADSLRLIDEPNIAARQAVESALREEVLETARYPEIVFKSRSVSYEKRSDGTYDARIAGELRLHGVSKPIVVPARVSLQDGTLRAIGTFDLRQTDYKITPFSFVSGTVTIKDNVTLSFDIVATQSS